eukprot:s121_g29.t2
MNLGSLSSLRSSKNTARLYQIRVIIHRCLVFLWGDPPKWKWVICHPCHLLVPGPKDWPSGRGGVENTYLRAKVQDAIGEVGSAVASGCVTTCGAAVFLLFCQIRIFTRFGQVLVVNMVCSLVFALLWIPAVLELRQKRAPGVDSDEGYAMGLLGEEGLRFCCPARLSKTGEIDAGVLTEPPVLVVFVMLATEPLQVLPSLVLLTVLSGPTSSRAFCCLIVRDILASMAETVTRAAIWVSPKRIAISVVAAGAISALLLVTAGGATLKAVSDVPSCEKRRRWRMWKGLKSVLLNGAASCAKKPERLRSLGKLLEVSQCAWPLSLVLWLSTALGSSSGAPSSCCARALV